MVSLVFVKLYCKCESAAWATSARAPASSRMQSKEQRPAGSTLLDATTNDWWRSFMAEATRWNSCDTGVDNMCCGREMSAKSRMRRCDAPAVGSL